LFVGLKDLELWGDPLSLDAYDYELPPDCIAQEPAERREGSRLLVLDRHSGKLEITRFAAIPSHLQAGDLLVLNDARVFPARFRFQRPDGGAAEIFLLEPAEPAWEALVRPARWARQRLGRTIEVPAAPASPAAAGRPFQALVLEDRGGGRFLIRLIQEGKPLGFDEVIALCELAGEVPLPPYIRRAADDPRRSLDRERYQTVFARAPVAVAAPTAGLHFTPDLLGQIQERGIETVQITHQVGAGTFLPLRGNDLRGMSLHAELTNIPGEAVRTILAARRSGRRIIACGTTTARALESFALAGAPVPYQARTDLFIKPGHRFEMVTALITNFHLPKSSLLVLVSAFAGRERILEAYGATLREGFRFYSYGDAMLIR
jgi:S-adenosylmethionine:tRNA ribosyltransferase-isomerase